MSDVPRSPVPTSVVSAAIVAVMAVGPNGLRAQDTAQLRGRVREQDGPPVTGAVVRFTRGDASATTDAMGRFVLRVPAGAAGTLAVGRVGFWPMALAIPAWPAERTREVAETLPCLAPLDVVSAVAERPRPLVNTRGAATGGTVERAERQRLPAYARDPIALAYDVHGVAQGTGFFGEAPKLAAACANGSHTQYSLDGPENDEGFLGGPRVEVPLSGRHAF